MLQRMNSIAPGPFDPPRRTESGPSGHIKSPSLGNSADFTYSAGSDSIKSHDKRPSTSSSNYTRNPSISSSIGGPRSTFSQHESDVPSLPKVPAVPSQQEGPEQGKSAITPKKPSPIEPAFDFGSFDQDSRSQTYPQDDSDHKSLKDKAEMSRRPSEPAVYMHKPKLSIAAAMQPLYDIGSASSFKPSRSLRGRTKPSTETTALSSKGNGGNETRADDRLENAPPVPMPTEVRSVTRKDSYHTPRESTSSNESYSSGAKSGSSRSSPPLNESPLGRQAQNPGDQRNQDLFNGFQFDVEPLPRAEKPVPTQEEPPPLLESTTYTRARKTTITNPPIRPTVAYPEGQSVQYEQTSKSPDDYVISSAPQSTNLHLSPAPPLPPPSSSPPVRRPTTTNKGKCRGCGELIKGKSVSSADGRLTGRYHKQCFVCRTCSQPFQTADFYVLGNHPYCGRHYHELNGSLCKNCDRGIEGQYLETELKLKFHPYCFSCQECHRILRDDYFEWNGRTLCEQHAFRAAQQPSSLGPGRRFPERRTTRLMMM